jgi:hypothetical protein
MVCRASSYLAKCLFFVCLPAAAQALAIQQSAADEIPAQQPTAAVAMQTEDVTQNLGPFGIAGEKFTVILRAKRLPEAPNRKQMQTLSALEIRDHANAVLYKRTFAYQIVAGKFAPTLTASVKLLPATNGNGLLITYREESSATQGATYWQVFGFIKGKLGLFASPASPEIPGATAMMMGAVARGGVLGMPMAQQGDAAELRLWTGNFYVIVPIFVDWRNARLLPGQRCLESGGGPGLHERGCDLRVEARRKPSENDLGFVRMFREPQEYEGGARHVVVKKDSQVEYLMARSIIGWTANGDFLQATFPDLWLKVLIDNDDEKEGWIHTEQEFQAVGLPSMGSQP